VSVLGDEPEAADRIVSWAKYAAALRRISRSVRSSATSRRSRRNSSNSDGATASGSAWRASSARWSATQFRNVVSFTPSRRATDARESSLDNASCTASRRNSSGYFDGRPNKGSFLQPHGQNQVSTRAGQAQRAACARSGHYAWVIFGAHVVLYSSDADGDRSFLSEVFGFDFTDAGEGWLIFGLPPAEVAVHPAESPGSELYLMCRDLDAEMRRLTGRGVACSNVEEARWGTVTKIRLPGRGELGLYQPRHPTMVDQP
jgi:hypothetical protein